MNMKQRKEWMSPGEKPKPRIKKDLHPMKTMCMECNLCMVGLGRLNPLGNAWKEPDSREESL